MAFHHVLFIHEVLTFNFNLNQVKDYNIVFYFCCMSEFASGQDVDCKTVRIFAYSSTREQANKRSGMRLKTGSETGERR